MNLRLFIAITPPEAVLDEIGTVEKGGRQLLLEQNIRWEHRAKWHITLSFLGNVRSELLDELTLHLREIPRKVPFQLTLDKVGAFPSLRRPRVLWIGFGGDLAVLQDLYSEINRAVSPIAPVEETRTFTPHLTLARVRTPLSSPQLQALAKWSAVNTPQISWQVEEFELWESTLGRGGSKYTRVAVFPLVSSP